MTVLRKRDRQVAFRVSEEEYRSLQMACLATRARSISDLAREAAKNVAAGGSPALSESAAERAPSSFSGRMVRVEEALELLMQEIREIKQSLGSGPRTS